MCLKFLVRFNKADWKAPGKEKKSRTKYTCMGVHSSGKETAFTSQDLKMNESQQAFSK